MMVGTTPARFLSLEKSTKIPDETWALGRIRYVCDIASQHTNDDFAKNTFLDIVTLVNETIGTIKRRKVSKKRFIPAGYDQDPPKHTHDGWPFTAL